MNSLLHKRLRDLMIRHGERAEPLAFAGREELIGRISDVVSVFLKGQVEGQTFIVGGPPGAGKTSLIRETARRLDAQDLSSVVCSSPLSNDEISELIWDVGAKLTDTPKEKLLKSTRRQYSASLSIPDVVGVGGGYSAEDKNRLASTIQSVVRLSNREPNRPVVVFVDEAQNIEKGSLAAALMNTLHTQSEYPLLLVCAGLANTYDRLQQAGFTRPESRHVISLGGLAPQESLEAATQSLRVITNTGVEGHDDTMHVLARRIAEASDNWPRHLTCYLHGVCESLLDQQDPSLRTLNIEETLERGNELRNQYYEDRLASAEMPISVISEMYEQLQNTRLLRDECAGVLENLIMDLEGNGAGIIQNRFPSGEDAFARILKSGLITVYKNNPCEIPIPSMRTFVIEKHRNEQVQGLP